MAIANSDYKEHISITERNKWDKVVEDFYKHRGAGGVENHMLATGAGSGTPANQVNTPNGTPGFSQCDFTPIEKGKLNTVEWRANYYIHPATHPASMITGLAAIATSGSWNNLIDIPWQFPGDAKTVSNGIRITIGESGPSDPNNDKEIWIQPSTGLAAIYHGNTWLWLRAVYG